VGVLYTPTFDKGIGENSELRIMYKPKKKFGQHFLNDLDIASKIIENADLHEGDNVWEIGPGMGVLTDILTEKKVNLSIFEIDNDLIPLLNKKYTGKCQLFHSDILKVDWKKQISGQKIKIVTNLPYQISSPFLYKLVENSNNIDKVILMLQKEVAKRLCANPGTKDYGVLTIKTGFYFRTEYLFDVTADKFSPQPKVNSAVIRIVPRIDVPQVDNTEMFWKIVEMSFVSRRKTLRNNLKSLDLKNCSIDLGRRAETLSEGEFVELYKQIS